MIEFKVIIDVTFFNVYFQSYEGAILINRAMQFSKRDQFLQRHIKVETLQSQSRHKILSVSPTINVVSNIFNIDDAIIRLSL